MRSSGLGAAAYSPAKYGILTELLPPSQLVKANGWIEGLTIASIILGILLGGQLVGPRDLAPCCWASTCRSRHRHRHAARSGDRRADLASTSWPPGSTCASRAPTRRCSRCRRTRWSWCATSGLQRAAVARQAGPDLAGHHHAVLGRVRQPALHRPGLGAAALGYSTTQASSLVGVVAIGTAVGAIVASVRMRLDKATQRDPARHRAWAC